ncbi:MAG: hypothetical protein M1815_000304 [Lichina confinis]|nr:MAG: hypothetical protein M1815_000304 [Lichina confinis]
MVLESASSPSSPEFGDDSSPGSDGDQYSNHPANPRQILAKMRRTGPVRWYSDDGLINLLRQQYESHSMAVQRPLTGIEAWALAEHSFRAVNSISIFPPLVLAMGLGRAYKTRHTFSFPFYNPNLEKFNFSRFFFLEGPPAKMAWQVCRFGVYGGLSSFLGLVFATNYAMTVKRTKEMRDPRLRTLNEERFAAIRAARAEQAASSGNVSGSAHENSQYGDDASPSSTTYGESGDRGDDGYYRSVGIEGNNDGMLYDRDMMNVERRQQASPRPSQTSNAAGAFDVDQAARRPSDLDDYFEDDTSRPRGTSPGGSRSTGSGGSVWDSLRQQPGSGPSTSASRRSPGASAEGSSPSGPGTWAARRQRALESSADGSASSSSSSPPSSSAWSAAASRERPSRPSPSDSYSFSSSEQDKQLAKVDAQREFDEQIERERRGEQ